MEREAFILSNGDSFSAWEIRFTGMEQHRETYPFVAREPDGSSRNGVMGYTVRSASVSFCASPGLLKSGQEGQLSSLEEFFNVTVSLVEPMQDHLHVTGKAVQLSDYDF